MLPFLDRERQPNVTGLADVMMLALTAFRNDSSLHRQQGFEQHPAAEYRPEATSQVPGSTAANVVEYTAQTVEGVHDFTGHIRSKLSTILSWCGTSASISPAFDFGEFALRACLLSAWDCSKQQISPVSPLRIQDSMQIIRTYPLVGKEFRGCIVFKIGEEAST